MRTTASVLICPSWTRKSSLAFIPTGRGPGVAMDRPPAPRSRTRETSPRHYNANRPRRRPASRCERYAAANKKVFAGKVTQSTLSLQSCRSSHGDRRPACKCPISRKLACILPADTCALRECVIASRHGDWGLENMWILKGISLGLGLSLSGPSST